MDWAFPGAWNGPPPPPGHMLRIGWGTSAKNGTAATALFTANASLYQLGNVTQWGPGANVRCAQPFAIAFQSPTTYAATTSRIHTQSNLSDLGEADNVSAYDSPSNVSRLAFINNSFSFSNSENISTCGGPVLTRPFQSSFLTIDVPFTVPGGRSLYHTSYRSLSHSITRSRPTVEFGRLITSRQVQVHPEVAGRSPTYRVPDRARVKAPRVMFATTPPRRDARARRAHGGRAPRLRVNCLRARAVTVA